MNTAYYISVWLHIICAAFWIGGMLFLPLVLLPGIKNNPERRQVLMVTGLKFRFYGWIVLSLLVVTGFLNIHFRGIHFSRSFFTQSSYGRLVVVKIILFITILLVSLVHDLLVGSRAVQASLETAGPNRVQVARWSGRILLLVSLTMAFLGVIISRGG
jgi:putative copper export protein